MIGTFWTAAEDAAVRELYPVGGSRAVAAKIARSMRAISARAQRLGVPNRPRWSADAEQNLRDTWGALTAPSIVAATGHSVAAVHKRAYRLGLGLGCPKGFEYLTACGRRTGFSPSQLRRIFRWAGVTIHRAMVRQPDVDGSPRHYVDPRLVDAAIADWLRTETPGGAAKRYGVAGRTLREWLRRASDVGVVMPKDPARGRRHWRVLSTVIDDVVRARMEMRMPGFPPGKRRAA